MKIDGLSGISNTRNVKKKENKTADSSFDALLGAEDKPEETSVTSTSPLAPMGGLIAAQQFASQDESETEKAVNYGNQLLDTLDHFRMQLLSGAIDPQDAKSRLHYIKKQHSFIDPALQSVINDIEMRIEIEIAKLG